MTVHKAHPRIIRLEGNSQIPASRQKCDVPPWLFVEVKSFRTRAHVVVVRALGKDFKVVAVEVDGVGGGSEVFGFVREEELACDDDLLESLVSVLFF